MAGVVLRSTSFEQQLSLRRALPHGRPRSPAPNADHPAASRRTIFAPRRPPTGTFHPAACGNRCRRSACPARPTDRAAARGSCGRAARRSPCTAATACGTRRTARRPSRPDDDDGPAYRTWPARGTARTSWLPVNFSFSECGSWQSVHCTRLACILLCRNEPYSYTSSRIWPSAWYRPCRQQSRLVVIQETACPGRKSS